MNKKIKKTCFRNIGNFMCIDCIFIANTSVCTKSADKYRS